LVLKGKPPVAPRWKYSLVRLARAQPTKGVSQFMANSAKKKNSKSPAKSKRPVKKASRPKVTKARAKSSKPAKKPAAKVTKKITARPGKSPKANGERKNFARGETQEILVLKYNKQRKLDPFVRGQ